MPTTPQTTLVLPTRTAGIAQADMPLIAMPRSVTSVAAPTTPRR